MRFGRLSVVAVGIATVAVGSWLLLADVRVGESAGGGVRQARPGARAARPGAKAARRAREAARREVSPGPKRYGGSYCGGYGGSNRVCCPASLSTATTSDFVAKGRLLCASSDSNVTGDNADLSFDVFLADLGGGLRNMTKDTLRCQGGTKAGQTCTSDSDCPMGDCRSPYMGGCGADAKGKAVYFVFSGNPTGGNNDLGDEIFSFIPKQGVLTQLTTQSGWCSDDATKACTASKDCGMMGSCIIAFINDLQVSPDGRYVSFVSTGDPAEAGSANAKHSLALFSFVTKGRGKGLKPVAVSGNFCTDVTVNRGAACATDQECGAVCGDGKVEAPEECDGGTSCTGGKYCARPGSTSQCTCQTPQCGNGIIEGSEQCDGEGTCGLNYTCGAPGSASACLCTYSGS
jgi:hypothetical protein